MGRTTGDEIVAVDLTCESEQTEARRDDTASLTISTAFPVESGEAAGDEVRTTAVDQAR